MKNFVWIFGALAYLIVSDFQFLSVKSEVIEFYNYDDGSSDAEEIESPQQTKDVIGPERSVHNLFPPEDDELVEMTPGNMEMFTTPATPPPTFSTTTKKGRRDPLQTTTWRSTRYPEFLPVPTARPNVNPNSCDISSCGCGNQYIPFCATNGVTYRNECQLNCVQRNCNPGIRVRFEGVCPVQYNQYG